MECGVDEVARGCLFGRVYAGAVLWSTEDLADPPELPKNVVIRDSKKMSHAQRLRAATWIKQHAKGWYVDFCTETQVEELNILQAALEAMRGAIDGVRPVPDTLAIDGTVFTPHKGIPHRCIPQGDRHHFGISCAAILAKVAHDAYIRELCEEEPWLEARYKLLSNMGYGTKQHLAGIKTYGVTAHHRNSFNPCTHAAYVYAAFQGGRLVALQAAVRVRLAVRRVKRIGLGVEDVQYEAGGTNACFVCKDEIMWHSQICGRCARSRS